MATIDPNNTWRLVEQRLASESDEVVRRNLEQVLAHMKAEAVADIDGVVATLADQPRYRTHGSDDRPELNPSSVEAVRAFYDLTIVQTGAHRLELAVDRVIADRSAVLTEGTMRIAYPGRTLEVMGLDVDDPEAHYLYETRMAVVWPVDEASGRLVGEEVYTVGDGFAGITDRKLAPSDILSPVVD
ncbi:MAG: nuclear transport factor 2 family protein [Acidimicrobiales bacterium]